MPQSAPPSELSSMTTVPSGTLHGWMIAARRVVSSNVSLEKMGSFCRSSTPSSSLNPVSSRSKSDPRVKVSATLRAAFLRGQSRRRADLALQLLARGGGEARGEQFAGVDQRPSHVARVLRQVPEQLGVAQVRRLPLALGGHQLPDAPQPLRQRLQLRLGQRLLEQVSLLERLLRLREKLPRFHAARSTL